jgi:hypothetical protein
VLLQLHDLRGAHGDGDRGEVDDLGLFLAHGRVVLFLCPVHDAPCLFQGHDRGGDDVSVAFLFPFMILSDDHDSNYGNQFHDPLDFRLASIAIFVARQKLTSFPGTEKGVYLKTANPKQNRTKSNSLRDLRLHLFKSLLTHIDKK